jgi:osmoprotectant transport system permease protein
VSEQLRLLPGYSRRTSSFRSAALCAAARCSRSRSASRCTDAAHSKPALLGAASAIQTIPGLALLADDGSRSSLRSAPAASAPCPRSSRSTLYSLLPILRNTVAGLAGVDPDVREAARGVGMTPREELLRVELPLALPVIVAGVRTSAVWVVGNRDARHAIGARASATTSSADSPRATTPPCSSAARPRLRSRSASIS